MDLTQSLSLSSRVLKLCGFWPSESNSKLLKVLQLLLFLTFMVIHCLTQVIYIFLHRKTYGEIVSTTLLLLIEMTVFPKCYILIKYVSKNNDLMDYLKREEFKPKESQHYLVRYLLGCYKILSHLYSCIGICFICLWPIRNFFQRTFPWEAWYPFNSMVSPFYECALFFQTASVIYISICNISCDNYFAGLLAHIAVQCELLSNNLENLQNTARVRFANQRGKTYSVCLEDCFNDCMHHYSLILKFSENVSIFLRYSYFCQFAANLSSYALTLYHVTMLRPLSADFFFNSLYLIDIYVQLFLITWEGNEVIMKSSKISEAAFQCGWEDGSQAMKKKVLFFIVRTQKPIVIYILNIFNLSVESFMSIIRTSYSSFTLLRQMNENEN